jgi:rod shape determining protein RodA
MIAIERKYFSDFDWGMLGLTLAVALFGIIEISSAQPFPGLWQRQIINLGVGLAVMFAATLIDYRKIAAASMYLYGLGVVMLVLVLTPLGRAVNGNQNWLDLGPLGGVQPSEFAKVFTILILAQYLGGRRERPLGLKSVATAGAIWVVPAVLVFLGHDTGSTLSFISFLAAMLFLAGLRWSWIAAAVLAIVLVGVLAIPHIKAGTGYKLQRIKAVYWPDIAEKQYRYQNEQAEIAVGSGGLFGKGFHSGTQGSLGFVPEVHTDFIFAVTCEETGFVGATFALTIYLLVISKLVQIARQARDRTGMLFVGGFAALLLYHVTVSVGMVLRLLPIMGIPLPLMSYGGSSLMATFLGLGLALNVRLRRFVN